jgi:hypothetical protein
MRRFYYAALAAVVGIGFGSVASAADLPTKAPVYKAPAAVVTDSGYYFWLDGMYDRVRLPTYSLGLHNTTPGAAVPPFTDMGSVNTFDPRLDGGGVRGAIGYVLPGTSTKFEFGGSYVAANSSQSQSTSSPNNGVTALLLNGGQNSAFTCTLAPACTTAGSLSTSYSAWQFNGKVSNDWKYGSVTLTPAVAVFGGNTRVGQTLSQSFSQNWFPNTGTYSASTTEQWRDIGVRVGVDVNAPVTTALTVGIGGWVGGANRRTSLSGNDAASNSGGSVFTGNSALSIGDSKTVLLANAEAGFVYKFTQTVALRGFAGLNYDGSVPGIASPTYTGSITAPTSRTAASIYYANETNYYAGGGVAVKW